MLGSLSNYRVLLKKYVYPTHETLPVLGQGVAGIFAGWTVSFIAAPVEHVKARLQVQYHSRSDTPVLRPHRVWSAASSLPRGYSPCIMVSVLRLSSVRSSSSGGGRMMSFRADVPYEDKANTFAVARFLEDDQSKLIPRDPPDANLYNRKPSDRVDFKTFNAYQALPEAPDGDFANSKLTNQIAIKTFNAHIEPYFRPFSDDDRAFHLDRGDNVSPYIIPKLGKHYSKQRAEEDGGLVPLWYMCLTFKLNKSVKQFSCLFNTYFVFVLCLHISCLAFV
jgi:hypothetical protein